MYDSQLIPADASPRLTALLGQVSHHRVILQGREVVDLAAGIRGVAVGLTGDAVSIYGLERDETCELTNRPIWAKGVDQGWTRSRGGIPPYQLPSVSLLRLCVIFS